MAAEHAAVDMHDLARPDRLRLQLLHQVGVAALRHEADILAVMLVGDPQAELARDAANLVFAKIAKRKAQEIELLLRRREEEIALVAVKVDRAEKSTPSADRPGAHVMAGRHRRGIEVARSCEQVGEFDGLVA